MNILATARCLLLGLAFVTLIPTVSQSTNQNSISPGSHTITVRELRIPPRAQESMSDGIRRLVLGDLRGGKHQFRRAIAQFPGYYEAYFYLGLVELDVNQFADAERNFRKSIELSVGGYAPAYFGLATALGEQKSFSEALVAALIGLEMDRNYWFGYYTLARAEFALGRMEDAEQSAREALARNADVPEIYQLFAYIHARQNKPAAAIHDLDEFIARDPEGAARTGAMDIREKIQRVIYLQGSVVSTEP